MIYDLTPVSKDNWQDLKMTDFKNIMKTSIYYLTQSLEFPLVNCSSLAASVYYLVDNELKLMSTSYFEQSKAINECRLHVDSSGMFDNVTKLYGDDIIMVSPSDKEDNLARVMIKFKPMPKNCQVSRLNAEDVLVSESGVFFSVTMGDPSPPDRVIFDKVSVISYQENMKVLPVVPYITQLFQNET